MHSDLLQTERSAMTLLQMQYVMEVCRCGSTLKAAQAANVSQATISMAIRALE